MVNRIIRYRKTQSVTLDDFITKAIDEQKCKNCIFYEECKHYMPDIDTYDITGCTAFDNTIENLENIYKKQYCWYKVLNLVHIAIVKYLSKIYISLINIFVYTKNHYLIHIKEGRSNQYDCSAPLYRN